MTTAAPKPRAGEHVPGRRFSSRYPEGIGGDYYMQPDPIKELEAERDLLRERELELVAALKAASEALRSSRHIMGDAYNRELAVELADKCDAALAKHGR